MTNSDSSLFDNVMGVRTRSCVYQCLFTNIAYCGVLSISSCVMVSVMSFSSSASILLCHRTESYETSKYVYEFVVLVPCYVVCPTPPITHRCDYRASPYVLTCFIYGSGNDQRHKAVYGTDVDNNTSHNQLTIARRVPRCCGFSQTSVSDADIIITQL